LLGHEVRWQLVRILARSDHQVNELVELVGERQNLVSYHLNLLRLAELVSERRSSSDARDVYYHLDLDRVGSGLDAATAALHPSLHVRLGGPALQKVPDLPQRRILFVCTGNSARSLIAEALMRAQSGGALEVHSAGPRPAGVHPLALEVISEWRLATRGLRSKGLEEVADIEFDHVITLCDIAREQCPRLPGDPEYIHWSLADPAAVMGSMEARRRAFRAAAAELNRRISHLVSRLASADSRAASKPVVGGKTHA
jgi:protein-tyrosine-phosphatase